MGKVSELSVLVDELRKCGETLVGISQELADMLSGAEEEKQLIKRLRLRRKQLRNQSRNRNRRQKGRSLLRMSEPCVRINPAVVLRQRLKQFSQSMAQTSCRK